MSDYNLKRGEDLFFNELNKLTTKYPQISTEIMVLGSSFSNKVGVMQDGLVDQINFKDENDLAFELNGVPAYKRLSLCVLDTLINCQTQFFKEQLSYVIKSYNNGSYKKYEEKNSSSFTKNQEEIENDSKKIEENLRNSLNLKEQEMVDIDKDGNSFLKSFEVDEIDLLEDFDDEDITLEGFRSLGSIDTNFDTTLDNEIKINKIEKHKYGKVIVNSDFDIEIICPYTNSNNVYQIDSTTYASFETDQPFKIKFNLADLKPDQS